MISALLVLNYSRKKHVQLYSILATYDKNSEVDIYIIIYPVELLPKKKTCCNLSSAVRCQPDLRDPRVANPQEVVSCTITCDVTCHRAGSTFFNVTGGSWRFNKWGVVMMSPFCGNEYNRSQ